MSGASRPCASDGSSFGTASGRGCLRGRPLLGFSAVGGASASASPGTSVSSAAGVSARGVRLLPLLAGRSLAAVLLAALPDLVAGVVSGSESLSGDSAAFLFDALVFVSAASVMSTSSRFLTAGDSSMPSIGVGAPTSSSCCSTSALADRLVRTFGVGVRLLPDLPLRFVTPRGAGVTTAALMLAGAFFDDASNFITRAS